MVLTRDQLQRIYWLGGSPCAGKSTVARLLADRLGWRVYCCDDQFAAHRERATPQDQPTFYRLSRLRGDALWLRPVPEQIATEIAFCADEFSLVLQDLAALAGETTRPILFEGAAALPAQLSPLLPAPNQALYLIPSESFQRSHYAQRPWIHRYLAETTDPEQAFENWMARDAGFARWLAGQMSVQGLAWLPVDGSLTVPETVARVADHFGDGSAR